MSFTTRPTTGSVVGTYTIVPSADGPTIGNYIVTPITAAHDRRVVAEGLLPAGR